MSSSAVANDLVSEVSVDLSERSSGYANVKAACDVLVTTLPTKTFFTGSSAYTTAQTSYFSAQEQALLPTCIVEPTTSADVSLIVKALAKAKAKFAIRGGGHTLNAGAANIASGITINLRSMKDVTYNATTKLISIGGGARWGEVYPVLDTLKLATSGGRVSDVGVGGLSTGGGISYFSAREGLVCDNIVNYEIILASGEIVQANANTNADLWHALKGGSSNFGIVTRFDIRTFEQGDFYGGVVASSYSSLKSQLAGYSNLLANYDSFAALIMSISWNLNRGGYNIFTNIEYTKNVVNPPIMRPFTEASPQFLNTMRISNVSDFSVEASSFAANSLRNQYATTTFGGDLSMLTTVHEIWNESIATVTPIAGINWAMTIQPWPQVYDIEGAKDGGNSLGLSSTDGPLTLFLLSYSWTNASDDAAATAAAEALINDIDCATREAGHYSPFKYLNYAAYWQDPIAGYGRSNIANLRKVREKYDPSSLFQTGAPGGFKIPG